MHTLPQLLKVFVLLLFILCDLRHYYYTVFQLRCGMIKGGQVQKDMEGYRDIDELVYYLKLNIMADNREGECLTCRELMRDFTAYREQVIVEKEAMRRQIEKSKQQLQKFMTKLDKRVESRINEERLVNNHNLQKLQQFHRQQQFKAQSLGVEKDRMIEQLRSLLRESQKERKELIQSNTKVLVEMSKQMQRQGKDKSYWQLMKMYQFLIEQNNQLKKEIYIIRRNNVSKQEKSGYQSEQKPKEGTLQSSSKPDNFNMSKSFTSKDGEKPHKKVPKSKHK